MTSTIRIVVAGILAVPALLLIVAVAPVVAILSLVPLAILQFRKEATPPSTKKHVICTGGSSGIGLAIAKECSQRKDVTCITLIARNADKLNVAKSMLETQSQVDIQVVSADVTDAKAMEGVAQRVMNGKDPGITTHLFTCAGSAHPGYFQEISANTFRDQVTLNYLGTVYTVKAFLPFMSKGTLTMVSSGAGQVGVFGYTAYSPAKFALRGFAECLHMELVASHPGLAVQLAFPNDTNTPGYEEEQKLKPPECQLISEAAGLSEPHEVAKQIVLESLTRNPKFTICFGLEGWLLNTLTSGMSPEPNLVSMMTQVTCMGLFRFISFFFMNDFWSIVWKQQTMRKSGVAETSSKED